MAKSRCQGDTGRAHVHTHHPPGAGRLSSHRGDERTWARGRYASGRTVHAGPVESADNQDAWRELRRGIGVRNGARKRRVRRQGWRVNAAGQSRADQAGEVLHGLLAIKDADLIPLRWERLSGRLDGSWQFLRLQQRTAFWFYLPSENDKRYPVISRADLKGSIVVANLGPTRPFGLAGCDASKTVKGVRAARGEIACNVLASEGVEQAEGADGLSHLTFLCSCETASPEAEQGLGGLGQRLVRDLGMPAVVAMTEPVAISLAERLGV